MAHPLAHVFSDDLFIAPERMEALLRLQRRVRGEVEGAVTKACQSCALAECRELGTKPVPGEGAGRIMFIGHRIGEHEAKNGRPAFGPASNYGFSLLLEAIDPRLTRYAPDARDLVLDYAYVTNASRCGTQLDAPVSAKTWAACTERWMTPEIRYVDPVVLVFWNKTCARAILDRKVPVGQVFEADFQGKRRPCFVLGNHPAILGRSPEYRGPILGDYKVLASWLYDEGYLLVQPDTFRDDTDVEHVLVRDRKGLEACMHALWDHPFLAFDTETFYHSTPDSTEFEKEAGALRWERDHHALVSAQWGALELVDGEPTMRTTYTLCTGFIDKLTGRPQQSLTVGDVARAQDALLRHVPVVGGEPRRRTLVVFNAGFDTPVATRNGTDISGLGHRDYDIEVIDSQLIECRIYEHFGKAGELKLDSLCRRYLQMSKGSFTDRFDPRTFAYEDLSDDETRYAVTDYCGGDPYKTGLIGYNRMKALAEHARSLQHVTNSEPSSLPVAGFAPYPKVNVSHTGSRLRDVAIPIDHQMIPILMQMRMTGFRVETETFRDIRGWVTETKRKLRRTIADLGYPWYKPSKPAHITQAMHGALREVAERTTLLVKHARQHGLDLDADILPVLNALGVAVGRIRTQDWVVEPADLVAAYENRYGPIDAKKQTVEEQFLIYLETGLRPASELASTLPAHVVDAVGFHEGEDGELSLIDLDTLEAMFRCTFVHNKIHKAVTAYFDRFETLTDTHGVFYPEFNLFLVVSGRLAGNFQNVPRGGPEATEFAREICEALGIEDPTDDQVTYNDRLDVRQFIHASQAEDLNRVFERMNLSSSYVDSEGKLQYKPWRVKTEHNGVFDEYVYVGADYAAQEDRMAYALTGDETKALLLSGTDPAGRQIDTHFYNVAFCFGKQYTVPAGIDWQAPSAKGEPHVPEGFEMPAPGTVFDTSTKEGTMQAYLFFTHPEYKSRFKKELRTPMKNVHYASQYGAGVDKIHIMIAAKFAKLGIEWTRENTEALVKEYEALYAEVKAAREAIVRQLDSIPVVEYPVFGTLRHAKNLSGKVHQSEYLSVANAYNQGTSAYLTKYAMIRLRHLIQMNAERWNLVEVGGDTYVGINLQVHDEIGVLCPKRIAHEVAEVLESAMKISVGPPDEDASARWGTMEDARGETGWLHLTDPGFKGPVLFDADVDGAARSIAKISYYKDDDGVKVYETLPNGLPNMFDWDDLAAEFPTPESQGVDTSHDLVVAQAERCPEVM